MSSRLAVKNGTIVTSRIAVRANLLVEDGKTARISRSAEFREADETIDARGLLVLPGIIDPHVHFREPGLTAKEDFATGSRAAAAGGVTCFFDMPNTLPPVMTAELLEEKFALAFGKSYVDFGLYGLIAKDSIPNLEAVAHVGAIGFKMFMGPTTGNIPPPTDGEMIDAFRTVAKTGLIVQIHAENQQIVEHFTSKLRKEGRKDPLAHAEARPSIAEEEAIGRAILFSSFTGAKISIAHMSTKEGVDMVRAAKKRGLRVNAETCPSYLLMTTKDLERLGPIAKANPPLRSKRDTEALWRGLRDGTVDWVASEHAPHTVDEKRTDNIWEIPAGLIGVETMLPLMLTQVVKGKLTLRKLVEVLSRNPAVLFGVYPKKGDIRAGSDADFTIVNPKLKSIIKGEKLHSKHSITPFEGYRTIGMAVFTVVRGDIVMRDGQVVGKPIGAAVKPTNVLKTMQPAVQK